MGGGWGPGVPGVPGPLVGVPGGLKGSFALVGIDI